MVYSDNALVTSAPTGSGKTVIFELAIVRLLLQLGEAIVSAKIVYGNLGGEGLQTLVVIRSTCVYLTHVAMESFYEQYGHSQLDVSYLSIQLVLPQMYVQFFNCYKA